MRNGYGDAHSVSQAMLSKYAPAEVLGHFEAMADKDLLHQDILPNGAWTRDPSQLALLCSSDPFCAGFTSEGWLKYSGCFDQIVDRPGTTLYIRRGYEGCERR